MPRYVIHIGPPKAGSKYLQTSLAALSPELRLNGISYPTKLCSPIRQAHHQLFLNRLKSGPDQALEDEFAALRQADNRIVILSCEGFFSLTEEQLRYLRILLGDFPVDIVYYCRRWSERIPSLWKQNVKMGRIETLPEAYAQAVRGPRRSHDLNPSLIWRKFAHVFGRDSIRLVSFNNIVEKRIDLVEHFLDVFVGWRPAARPEAVILNESPDALDTEIIRALNAIHQRTSRRETDRTRAGYLKIKDSLDLRLIEAAMQNDLGIIVLDDHAAPFESIYADLSEYGDRLVTPELGTELFRRKATRYQYVRQNYQLDEGVAAQLRQIYVTVSAG